MPTRQLVSIRLPETLWSRVRITALEQGISAQQMVETALEAHLAPQVRSVFREHAKDAQPFKEYTREKDPDVA